MESSTSFNEDESYNKKNQNISFKATPAGSINIFSARARNVNLDIDKGKSISKQLQIWESLLENRVKLQPSLVAANKLYQKSNLKQFKSSLISTDKKVLTRAYHSLSELMRNLLDFQEMLRKATAEFINEGFGHCAEKEEATDNESITSDESQDVKEKSINFPEAENQSEPVRKKRKLNECEEHLDEAYKSLKPFGESTIKKWFDKTRVSSGKASSSDFSAFNQSTLKQIEQILCDKRRLIRKTQLKRTEYQILGKNVEWHNGANIGCIDLMDNKRNETNTNTNVYDPEIFDDDDFYHKLLRTFIESKYNDFNDSSRHERQLIELQKLRSKMKREVDTKASKARKLRYTIHNKLLNFMAPINCHQWPQERESILFASLFGKDCL